MILVPGPGGHGSTAEGRTVIDKDDLFPVGSVCVAVARVFFSFRGEVDRSRGTVEFCWQRGGATTVDTRSDWTLVGGSTRWEDPYRDVEEAERAAIHQEYGIFVLEEARPPDPLSSVVGGRLLGVRREFDEYDYWMDVDLLFDRGLVRLESWEGEVRIRVSDVAPGLVEDGAA
ncbi:hypothetical protein DLJ96_17925 [Actinotalea fermentans ATCC 43279 = JCM 9966 = DSM 3133]|nr:hypothetical protein DLJ96_17925 [Actinotalea fermentans ATCC 43279 = JCM 9966 = DSM 3133]